MKKFLLLFFILRAFTYSQELPFHKGVNLTNWFQAENPQNIPFNKFTKKDFERLKSLGADVIRLPINLHYMTSGAPDYNLDPLFLFMLDQVINWAEELKINLILDNHTFDVKIPTSPDLDNILVPVWSHMAERYKDRSRLIYYEVLNEPHAIADSAWNRIQMTTVNAIRKIDTIHTIVIGGASWNSYNNLSAIPIYPDTNLIYTFHFYDPFIFTHQGAGWNDPSMVSLSGVPFPYNSAAMPPCPSDLKGTWVESNINDYVNNGTVSKVQSLIDVANNFKESRNVKIYCGELGVLMDNAPDNDRTFWYKSVSESLELKNIPWTMWDYKGTFGLFEKGSNELFDYDLNIPLINALGFNEPLQKQYILEPDSTGFDIYTNIVGENIISSGSGTGITNFWNTTDLQSGEFEIYWTEAMRYNPITFTFKPIRDFSLLASEGYLIDFYMKGNGKVPLDIRFIDTKKDSSDHPWRMRYTLDSTNVIYDGTWQHIKIPLKNFTEHGSWDNNTWYNPEGKFDWKAIDRFEIDPEYSDMGTKELWFDNIKVVKPEAVSIKDNIEKNFSFELSQNYPNPFNPTTTMSFVISHLSFVTLKVYDLLGREVATIVNKELPGGNYKYQWNANGLASGVYFYQLKAIPNGRQAGNPADGTGIIDTKKLILTK